MVSNARPQRRRPWCWGSDGAGQRPLSTFTAAQVAILVRLAADATGRETELAARSAATAVAVAAALMAKTVSDAEIACDNEVGDTARALEDLNAATARRVASERRWRAAGAAIAAKQAADALGPIDSIER